jgi:hypothetical protein
VFSPPPGYEDMLGDAATAEFSEQFDYIKVPEVGSLKARRPLPNAIATLAMAANSGLTNAERTDYLILFISDHLAEGEMERVYVEMMVGEASSDSVEKIARALATWGTARPYIAVVTLAVMTAHHWRTIRLKMVQSGVRDPMRLPTMHILLDATETAVLEAMSTGSDGEMKRTMFLHKLYSPLSDPSAPAEIAAPPGFDDDDTEDAFDAFAAAAR